ncbi:hypothetical protein ACVIW0_001721 [Bradyrhizobium sp. USDA 4454]
MSSCRDDRRTIEHPATAGSFAWGCFPCFGGAPLWRQGIGDNLGLSRGRVQARSRNEISVLANVLSGVSTTMSTTVIEPGWL